VGKVLKERVDGWDQEGQDWIDIASKEDGICNCWVVGIAQCIADGPVQSPTQHFVFQLQSEMLWKI
jgi:hypothetical protein